MINKYLEDSIYHENKFVKMGSSYGLSGILRGSGIVLLDKELLPYIEDKINNKKFKNIR